MTFSRSVMWCLFWCFFMVLGCGGPDEKASNNTPTGDPTSLSTGTVAEIPCDDWQARGDDGFCYDDCRPSARTCVIGECNYFDGLCVPDGTPGILRGEAQPCGDQTCLAGTECSMDEECVASAPCLLPECDELDCCWGTICTEARPPGACSPAVLPDLNSAAFLDGAADIAFDDACTAYTVTILSGADYLRQMTPDGAITSWDGVTNLNMGEVSAQRVSGYEFGGLVEPADVVITYTCCATCGCQYGDPQGMAQLVRAAPPHLPMRIDAQPSTGVGPFLDDRLDTGPQGLVYGQDDQLYVGNVGTNGDFWRIGRYAQLEEEAALFDGRVYAAGVYAPDELLVSLSGGRIYRLDTTTLETELWATLSEDVTDLQRDPFTGFVLASTPTRIVELSRAGTEQGTFANISIAGRSELSADGWLYHLDHTYLGGTQLHRFQLPPTLP